MRPMPVHGAHARLIRKLYFCAAVILSGETSVFPRQSEAAWQNVHARVEAICRGKNIDTEQFEILESVMKDNIFMDFMGDSAHSTALVMTKRRNMVLQWAAKRMEMIRAGATNRDTSILLLGVRGNGKTWFCRRLLAALALVNGLAASWLNFENASPKLNPPANDEEPFLFGADELQDLLSRNQEDDIWSWASVKACMHRGGTLGLIAATDQFSEDFRRGKPGFPGFNGTVLRYEMVFPLIKEEYGGFFTAIDKHLPPPESLNVLHWWTGGRLGWLFWLHTSGFLSDDNLRCPHKLHAAITDKAKSASLFPSERTSNKEMRVQYAVSNATWLAVQHIPMSQLCYSDVVFHLPFLNVPAVTTDVFKRRWEDADWTALPLDRVLLGNTHDIGSMKLAVPSDLQEFALPPVHAKWEALASAASRIVLVVGAGLTMQSAEIPSDAPLDLRSLADSLLAQCGKSPGKHQSEDADLRWFVDETNVSLEEQQRAMWAVLHDNLPVKTVDVWTKLFETGRPVVTENYDLHAAHSLFYHIHKKEPVHCDEYRSVMLTWQSPFEELSAFFHGELVGGDAKVLYREGSILLDSSETPRWPNSGDWLMGSRHDEVKLSPTFLFIEDQLQTSPLLLVGIHGAVRINAIVNKLALARYRFTTLTDADDKLSQECQPEIFRIVRRDYPDVPLVADFHCRDYSKAEFSKVLERVVTTVCTGTAPR